MKDSENTKKIIIQFIKFGIVGGINTILSYIITNVGFYYCGLHEQICNIVAFLITVYMSFLFNGKFVFEKEKNDFWKTLGKAYASYSITGLFLTALFIFIEEDVIGIPHYIATLINLIVTIPLNFILNRFWTFK